MNPRSAPRALALLAAIAVTGSLTAPAASADPTPKAPKPATSPHDDFNGDGHQDLVVAAPRATVDGRAGAGYVSVLYGSATGPRVSSKQILQQGTGGVPGAPGADHRFGTSLAAADLDRDGYADLAVSAEGQGPPGDPDAAGGLSVIWGSPAGLGRGTTPATSLKGFTTRALVTGDFDGDGHQDLVSAGVGAGLTVRHGPLLRDGTPARTAQVHGEDWNVEELVELVTGDLNGDGATDIVGLDRDPGAEGEYAFTPLQWMGSPTGLGPIRRNALGNQHGDSIDVGDTDKDGYEDVVIGYAHWMTNHQPAAHGGVVVTIPGSATGPDVSRKRTLFQDSPGVPGTAETDDMFGADVSVGDIDGDGYEDIAVGVPGEGLGTVAHAGAVVTLPGSATGPTGTGAKTVTQNTPGVPGTAEAGDGFGSVVKLIDGNGGNGGTGGTGGSTAVRKDLAASAVNENNGAGSVWWLPATASGLTPAGSFVYGPGALGTTAAKGFFGEKYTS
ncbi:FG-GAP and VCBS repeat-containing protein [Streptomyces sp. NPDC001985]|uniref:FG-GAP and VCBS repeat-containing protein n=1 Tax=Streptomyces sp. NPDC001985 TaxID=3154406 RepID=UPI00331FE5AE